MNEIMNAGVNSIGNFKLMFQGCCKHMPRLVEVLLLLLLVWIVAGWILSDDNAEVSRSELTSTVVNGSSLDIELILNTPLFGDMKNKESVPVQIVKPVAPSSMKIQLLGTVVAGEKSAAVVMTKGMKDQKVLFLGDSVHPGVVLEKVMAEEIIFNRNGELERVALQKDGHQAVASPSPTVAPPSPTTISPTRSKMRDYRLNRSRR